jgi:hypothetical protein
MAEDALSALGDVDSLIADALKVIVDARNGKNEAEIDGHELVKREELNDAVIDFDLQLVDGVLFVQDALGQLLVGIQHGVDGLMDGAFGEAAHPKQPLFKLVQIFFEVAFHEFLFRTYNTLESKAGAIRQLRF